MLRGERRVVAAAVIRDSEGRVLLARRPTHTHLGALWEFPGGGVEEGEEPAATVARELREELGVEARVVSPLTFAWHRDEYRDVLLLFYEAVITTGTPVGQEGQEVRWVSIKELASLPTPPADAALIRDIVAAPGKFDGPGQASSARSCEDR